MIFVVGNETGYKSWIKKNMKNNLENGDVDEYDDDEWDVKWQDWRTDNEVRIVELTRLLLTWRTKNEMRGRKRKKIYEKMWYKHILLNANSYCAEECNPEQRVHKEAVEEFRLYFYERTASEMDGTTPHCTLKSRVSESFL